MYHIHSYKPSISSGSKKANRLLIDCRVSTWQGIGVKHGGWNGTLHAHRVLYVRKDDLSYTCLQLFFKGPFPTGPAQVQLYARNIPALPDLQPSGEHEAQQEGRGQLVFNWSCRHDSVKTANSFETIEQRITILVCICPFSVQ